MKIVKNWIQIIKRNIYMFKFVIRYVPSYLFTMLGDGIINGLINTVVGLLFYKELYEQIEKLYYVENASFVPILVIFLIVFLSQVFSTIWQIWYTRYYLPRITNKLHEKMLSLLYLKAKDMDLVCYDSPEFYDNFVWSVNQADKRAISVAENFGSFLRTIITVASSLVIVLGMDCASIVIIAVVVIISYVVDQMKLKIDIKQKENLNTIERAISYIGRIFYLDTYAKEVRLNNVEKLLFNKYDSSVDDLKKVTLKNLKDVFFIDLFSSTITNIVFNILYTMYLVFRVLIAKTLSIGEMLTVQTGTNNVASNISNIMHFFTVFKENSMLTEKFQNFMEYTPDISDNETSVDFQSPFEELELKNVGFSYKGSKNFAVKDISLKIKKNEKIALVGYNGAGKSTLIKLILRLYEPTDGEIHCNGQDIKNYKVEPYRNIYSTVFQDFILFSLSLRDNVSMGKTGISDEAVISALRKAGFGNKFDKLEHGLDTVLTREFDVNGTILSGGEMQKVAIARVLLNDNEFVIMDEPSSALDPDSEYELNKLMMDSSKNRTVIFISHRLSATRMADRIYMMADGKIIEQGIHDELMKLDGKYAEMFKLQAKNYQYDSFGEAVV